MKRPLLMALLLCLGFTVVAAPAVLAQNREGPPKELWDEFPLEPSPTPSAVPSAQAPQATPTPEVRVVEDSGGGLSPVALTGLLLVAGIIGAAAAAAAARRVRATPSTGPPVEAVAETPAAAPARRTGRF